AVSRFADPRRTQRASGALAAAGLRRHRDRRPGRERPDPPGRGTRADPLGTAEPAGTPGRRQLRRPGPDPGAGTGRGAGTRAPGRPRADRPAPVRRPTEPGRAGREPADPAVRLGAQPHREAVRHRHRHHGAVQRPAHPAGRPVRLRRRQLAGRWRLPRSWPGTAPTVLTDLDQRIGADVAGAYQRALSVEEFLADHYSLVTDAPSGHAYPNLAFFLFGPRNAGGQRGTSEQFAASFAVLARMLGLPSRVVVGFQARPGTGTVRGRDALAWPEVLFSG